jgi:hypothetical protein
MRRHRSIRPIDRAPIRLAAPDGVVFRSDVEIIETIKPFVVTLTNPAGLDSGFLVRSGSASST